MMAISVEPGKERRLKVPDYNQAREQIKEQVVNLLDMVKPLCANIIVHNKTKHAQVVVSFAGGDMHILITNEKQDEVFHLDL